MKQMCATQDEFVTTLFSVIERVGGRRPSGAWATIDLVSFNCGEDVFLAALRAMLGGDDTVKRAGWPHLDKWAACTYGADPIVFEFTKPYSGDGMVRGIRILS